MNMRWFCFFSVLVLMCVSCAKGNRTPKGFGDFANLVLGQPHYTSATNNAGAAANQTSAKSLSGPRGIFFEGNRLYIVDTANNRLLVWNSNPTRIQQPADLVLGQLDATVNNPNSGGSATCKTLSQPTAVFAKGNKLFIADTGNHRILVYKDVTTLTNGAVADFFIGHRNCEESRANQLDNDTIGVRGDTLNAPQGVFYDGSKIYISDTNNDRVLIYDGMPQGHGLKATIVIGQKDMESNSPRVVDSNTLNRPEGIFVRNNTLFISDTRNHRILVFNSLPTVANASANIVIGQTTFANNSSGTSQSTLSLPTGIHGDAEGIIIADTGNHRVLIFEEIPKVNGGKADFVIGQSDFTSGSANRGATANGDSLSSPRGVYMNGTVVWITDTQNHRALRFGL